MSAMKSVRTIRPADEIEAISSAYVAPAEGRHAAKLAHKVHDDPTWIDRVTLHNYRDYYAEGYAACLAFVPWTNGPRRRISHVEDKRFAQATWLRGWHQARLDTRRQQLARRYARRAS